MKKVSLATIAKQLGVSAVTVHKALKNQSGVSEELRRRIIALATELGYVSPSVPNSTQNFLYILQKDFLLSASEQYYSVIYYHLDHECQKHGAKLRFIVHDSLSATMASIRSSIHESPVDGIFIAGQVDKALLTEIEKLKKSVVCIDFFSSDYPFRYVYVDNFYAGYALTKYLIQHGHRRICFVGDIKFSDAVADRYFGYLRALNKFDIPDAALHINTNIERSSSLPEIELPARTTAYICHCDRAASVLYAWLEKAGYRIPEDVSVIGFDNTDLCSALSPQLTSTGIDRRVFAQQAFNLMQSSLRKTSTELNYIKLNLTLYERDSIRAIP